MKGNMTRETGLKWTAYALLVLVVLAGTYAGFLFLQVDEAESASRAARKAADDASGAAAKAQAQIKIATNRATEAEQKLELTKNLLAKLEPEVAPVLEAGGRTGKPSTRAASLATLGLIGQIVHGPKHEAALNALDRAMVADKDNCPAVVALKLSGEKDIEVSAECQSLMPAVAAAPAKPATAAPAAAKADAKGDMKADAKADAKADDKAEAQK
jgi:membrane-associated protease RseP (regulator of RpoE activity)